LEELPLEEAPDGSEDGHLGKGDTSCAIGDGDERGTFVFVIWEGGAGCLAVLTTP